MTSQKDACITSPDILPHDVYDILSSDPFLASVKVDSVAPITGGVAHNVYRIGSGENAYYLKIRGNHFTAVPTITCNPADIINEYRALTMFQDAAPDHFPRVLSFDHARHYLILSDVIQDGSKLDQVLAGSNPPEGLFGLYGQTLAAIQQQTAGITESVRPEGDEAYYHTVLGHRFGYRNHPVLNTATSELSILPNRQLIMGDPAPKNMGIRKNGRLLTFFDLETAHQGNSEFDYAYGLAHTMLHTMPNSDAMHQAVQQFLVGYGEAAYNQRLIFRLSLGIVLYRLHSVIPYPVALSNDEKQAVESHIDGLLAHVTGKESWEEVVDRMTDI